MGSQFRYIYLIRAYTVTHSETLYVFDPQARLYAVFTDPADDYDLLRSLSTWAARGPRRP